MIKTRSRVFVGASVLECFMEPGSERSWNNDTKKEIQRQMERH